MTVFFVKKRNNYQTTHVCNLSYARTFCNRARQPRSLNWPINWFPHCSWCLLLSNTCHIFVDFSTYATVRHHHGLWRLVVVARRLDKVSNFPISTMPHFFRFHFNIFFSLCCWSPWLLIGLLLCLRIVNWFSEERNRSSCVTKGDLHTSETYYCCSYQFQ